MTTFKSYYNLSEETNKESIFISIINFFQKTSKITDKEIHGLANELNIDEHVFENYIYELLSGFINAGVSVKNNITEKDVDSKQLEIGIEVEYEHTNLKCISKKIALDHLAEHDNYYNKLVEADLADEDAAIKLYKKYKYK